MQPQLACRLPCTVLSLLALGSGAGCERTGRPERESATAGDASSVAARPAPAPAVPPAVTGPSPGSAAREDRPPLASASSRAPDVSCTTRATCGSVLAGGTGLTFAASYCQGDLCRSARSKVECDARDVVNDCEAIVAGADGRPDCRWDDGEASRGIACRPNK